MDAKDLILIGSLGAVAFLLYKRQENEFACRLAYETQIQQQGLLPDWIPYFGWL